VVRNQNFVENKVFMKGYQEKVEKIGEGVYVYEKHAHAHIL